MDNQDAQHQQKGYFNNIFNSEFGADRGNESHHPSMYSGARPSPSPSPSTMSPPNSAIPNVPLNLDLVSQLIGLPGQQAGSIGQGQYSPQILLEQRLKLNQLQQLQLQNQILQQQLEFLNDQGTAPPIENSSERQNPFVGLPTPVNSAELHAQSSPSTAYISPITLGYVDTSHYRSNSQSQLPPDMHLPPHHISVPNDTRAAPADLVFDTTQSITLPSPGELDFDLSSPLSPWMDSSYKPDTSQQPRRNKRSASPHGEEQAKVARQRPSPTPRVPPTPNSTKRGPRSTKSASSTPLPRSSRAGGRKNSTSSYIPGDSPSPVDLFMPPPGPPASQPELNASTTQVNVPIMNSPPTSARGRPQQPMTPVTPASIMNLGGLGMNSGLAPPTHAVKIDGKGKSTGRGKDSSSSVPTAKKGNGVSGSSLKPILPAGNVSAPNTVASSSLASPVLRKTSHKAAEQKRRDSLKTTFDELRMLLPPIPLPSEEGYPDEPVLPGAMPPRGPPRGNTDGPNRSISKLQLLRCGNDYIRLLNDKISRRDDEIALLRSEIRRLRGFLVEDMWREGAEEIDLSRDVDLGELGPWRRSMNTFDGDDGEEDVPE